MTIVILAVALIILLCVLTFPHQMPAIIPTGSLALMLKRGKETIITKGDTRILAGDNLILSIPVYNTNETEKQ